MTMIFSSAAIAAARGAPTSKPQESRTVLPLPAWRELAARGDGSHRSAGILLVAAETKAAELATLTEAPLIVVSLARFTDGRAYSVARILRETYGYSGELRVSGDVLLDQIALLQRSGFDSFEIAHQPTIDALARGHLPAVTAAYQDLPRGSAAVRPTLVRPALDDTRNTSTEK